jgi:serine O-acetyltransferase
LKKDLQFAFDSDPACDSLEEIVYAYPGFSAILSYRIAHEIYAFGNKVAARVVSELAHSQTGIDINPGATIGSPFFIDHGTGIVIGETAVVGRYVKLYQGVTLGALTLSQGHALRGKKRHPTIGNYVTIYSGASILGDVNIGDNVVIGSNVFLMKSIEANRRVVIPEPELEIREKGGK